MEYQESDDNEQLVILSRSDEIHDDGQYGTHQGNSFLFNLS